MQLARVHVALTYQGDLDEEPPCLSSRSPLEAHCSIFVMDSGPHDPSRPEDVEVSERDLQPSLLAKLKHDLAAMRSNGRVIQIAEPYFDTTQ